MMKGQLHFLMICLSLLVLYDETLIKAEQNIEKIEWWKKTNYYHIYIRSFKDSKGDGEGDLRGVIEKVDYLKSLGVETLLLSPFYSSPMKDGGYDIDDYTAMNPRFGSMEDFDELILKLKENSMRIVVDFVPNHSSNQHKWFKCSERALIDPVNCGKYKDYYVWSNSTRFNNSRPTNWISLFGGDTAWRWSEIRKEFYLHQFLPEQPDLNLRDPLVREEFKEIVRFWLRKGVDGIRVDAVLHFLEDIHMRDEPQDPMWRPDWNPYDRLLHIYTRTRSESASVVKDWYDVSREPEFKDKVVIVEAYDQIPKLIEYYGPSEKERYSDMPFDFELFKLNKVNLNPYNVQKILTDWLNATRALNWSDENGAINPWSIWVTGNHDNMRITNKMGDSQADAYKYIAYLAPGVPVSYYGDEIGMHDTPISAIPSRTLEEGEPTRLAFRAPMAWSAAEPSGGFSTSADPWMPLNSNYKYRNVETLLNAPGKNHLKNFIQLLKVRREYIETLTFGDLVFFSNRPESSSLFAMARSHPKFGSLLLLVNFNNFQSEIVYLKNKSLSEFAGRVVDAPQRGEVVMLNKVVAGSQIEEGREIELAGLVLAPSQAILVKYQYSSLDVEISEFFLHH